MLKAILNKTGITTTQQPAYEGDVLPSKTLLPNKVMDITGFENGIFAAAYGIDKKSVVWIGSTTTSKTIFLTKLGNM